MSAILPPSERLWWKHPLDRLEAVWIGIAFVWCMVMFFMMVFWHVYGKQNLSTETYKTTPDKFSAAAQAMVDAAQQECPYSNARRGNVEVTSTVGYRRGLGPHYTAGAPAQGAPAVCFLGCPRRKP